MKKKQLFPALILAVCLVAVGIWSLARERAQLAQTQQVVLALNTDLQFTELCTKNETILADNDGRYRDYVELYNAGEDFDLTGCRLTDGKVQSAPLQQEILPAGGYRLFFLGDDLTGFALGASGGDVIQLLGPAGQVLVQTTTTAVQTDEVMLAEKNSYRVSTEASPGFANDAEGLAAFRTGKEDPAPRLVLSEVLVENSSALPNAAGIYCDVIELHNVSDIPLQLEDFYLSDTLQNRFRFRLPKLTLQPDQYVLVWCDSENTVDAQGGIHANFGLRHGDTLCITAKDGSYTALVVTFPGEDCSTVLTEDGTYAPGAVSLGYPNNESGETAFFRSRLDPDPALAVTEILLSSSGVPYDGRFCDVVEICNRSAQTVSTKGWYLSDSSDPFRYALPAQELAPGQRLLIPCERTTTGFGLSEADTLRLRTPEGLWANVIPCGETEENQSIRCTGAGEDTVCTAAPVTLGFADDETGRQQYLQAAMPGDLQISEMMSVNKTHLKGSYGTVCDWIELYNAGQEAVDLAAYALTDNNNDPYRYPLPAKTLQPGEYCVILLSETDENLLRGYDVLPMTLSSRGETLYLTQNGCFTDHAVLPPLAADMSFGRAVGAAEFSTLAKPTPGTANSEAALISQPVTAVTPQGVYPAGEMTVTLSAPGEIYYTTDCSVPNQNDTLYTGPISISKTTVLRVLVCEPGKEPSAVTDLTYFVGENDSLPAVSVVTAPGNLFDPYYGIYAEGFNAAPETPHIGANYWMDWEKPATVTLFEKDGSGFSEPCGLKIFGGFSRALYMKSFSCYFRSVYGASSLNYPLFGEEGLDSYECFILRSSGQDLLGARMRDVLATSLMAEHTNMPVQKYRPVVVYLNGQFWGVYYIREKINENYIAGNFNTTPDQVTLTVADGISSQEYRTLMQYVYSHDLSKQEHYDYVCSQIDVDNYIDYIIGEIWIGNGDNGNIKFFKTPEMKWTWIMYDTDWGFTSPSYDTVADHLNPWGTGSGDAFSTALIVNLLKNKDFEDRFLRRFAWQMQNIWNEETVLARVDELQSLLAHDLEKDYKRWNRSYNGWLSEVEEIRQFTAVRHQNIVVYLRSYFGLKDSELRDYGFPV